MEFRDGGFSDGAAASTSASHFSAAVDSDDDEDGPAMPFPSRDLFSNHHHHNRHFPLSRDDEEFQRRFGATENDAQTHRNDAWSGIVTFITFWCFVSMTLIFGVYGPEIYKLGPHSSILIKPNPLFVENVKVERLDLVQNKLMLYGFDATPPLSVVTSWSDSRKVIFSGVSHKEWMYFLNVGSKIDISYNVTSLLPSPLVLVIAEGIQGLTDWLEDPGSPKLTVLWKPIHGVGAVGQDIPKSASYYIAVGNLNPDVVEVELQIQIRALLYNTTSAYYKCSISLGTCILKIPFTGGNTALLAFSDTKLGKGNGKSRVQLSYGPRWITYLFGIGGVIVFISLAIHCINKCRRSHQSESSPQENMEPQGAPLIPRKDDDEASLGSSYDSLSQDCEDPEDEPSASSKGNAASDNEYDNNTRRLCAICFDAPRDCFFLPCGHCVSCYACGTKIAEVAGTCPICRRHMKKVKKIYTV